jgi:ligand-binding sensor domain-containing protein/signal transduction histidine kinase
MLFLSFLLWAVATAPLFTNAAVLWNERGPTLVHENGEGTDLLNGALKRDDSSTDTLYFKLHIDPLSDASTEEYLAALELYEGVEERLGMGNALKAWAYSAFKIIAGETGKYADYTDLHSSRPEPSAPGSFFSYELPHRGLESTLVFKVQYIAGSDDLVTVWLNPDLGPGATEASQQESLITHFRANASFDEIRLRHNGGGGGWIFSDLEIATSFDDFTTPASPSSGGASRSIAQGELPFTFRSWQTEHGLPQNFVRALAQTLDGCVWVGSDDGVARFDGLRFVPLGLREGLQSGPVRALLGDRDGTLWIGSAGGGLTRVYQGQIKTFTRKDGLPANSVTALAEDKQGRIWVGTEAGLAVWQHDRAVSMSGMEIFDGKRITALFFDSRGIMWLGIGGVGVFSYNDQSFTQEQDASLKELLADSHCVIADRAGRLWVGAGDDFLLCRENERWRPYRVARHQARPFICALAEDPEGTVWAGSVGEGLLEFRGGKSEVLSARSGLSDNLTECLLIDREGALWVGTHGGLNRLQRRQLFVFGQKEGLGYGAVHGLAEVLPGILWAGKPTDGLYRWDGRSFGRLVADGLSLVGPPVNALLRAQDGSCWVAGARGLIHFNDPSKANDRAELSTMAGRNVLALAEDHERGLWVGTREGEVWRWTQGQWTSQTNVWQTHPITAIVHGQDGRLYVGTEGGGLDCYVGESHTHFDRAQGLLTDVVRTLYLDHEGALWIGTAGGGLSRLWHERITTFTSREGLPDNTVSQILEDDARRLWLGSNRGIACVSKRELDELAEGEISTIYPQVYGRAEGMLSEECTGGFYPAGAKTRSGLLCFSTLKGIVVVDSHMRSPGTPAPPVLLEDVLVDGSRVEDFSARSGPMEDANHAGLKAQARAGPLRIGPGQHRIEVAYSAVSFDAPERVRFRYRLEALDGDWVDAGTRRTAFYNFVPPGNYRFRVSACNSDGIWGAETAGLTLVVLPHFWQTWWFLGLIAAGLAAFVGGSARIAEKRKLQRRLERLEQEGLLERERTRIAQDLHDEMGAKLCRISFLSENARRNGDMPAEVRQQITAISDDSRQVLQSLDEIVWAVDPQKDTLEHVVSYLGQYAQNYFQETSIECALEIPSQVPPHPLSAQCRHHLFLAVHEAFTNILKHSGATRAKVTISCDPATFKIVISDNGKGFGGNCVDSSLPLASGNGLRNMRERLAKFGGLSQLESTPGKGTTIGFILPLSRLSHKG